MGLAIFVHTRYTHFCMRRCLLEKDTLLKPVLTKARKIVQTFRKSAVATGELVERTELTLIADVSTRWNSTLLFLKRLYELKDSVQDIMSKHLKIPCLTPDEWVTVSFIIKLLDKFNTVTDDFSAEKTATIHRVYYSVNGLVRHLESIRHTLLKVDFSDYGTENPFDQVILAITSELDRVLGYTVNESNPNFDAIYLVGTFLHKTLRFTLTAKDQSLASRWLTIKNAEWYRQAEEGQDDDIAVEPQARTFGRDDKLDFFIIAEMETVVSRSPIELKIQSYMEIPMCSTDQVDSNPEEFWISASGKFPLLSRLALDILAIPAAPSAPERVFAIATLSTMGKANRLAGRHLERKVLCLRNTADLPGIDD